ncbi:MAG TPA: glycerate kinase [Xanthobacteraceae bacterium]|nr:glycerate kinase [Xanthobacteraceae bacterium]
MNQPPRQFLESLYGIAVAAAHPANCLVGLLPSPPRTGRLLLLAAGKAAGSMTEIAERYYLDDCGLAPDRIAGLAVTRRGYSRPTRMIRVVEAGHPIPDDAGAKAAAETLALADSAHPDDLVLVLLSGGASANWIAPAGITLAEKQALTRALVGSGASIGEINAVRKHLSAIKGGRLARRTRKAPLAAIAISDVPGDDPAVIGSGPTVADPSTLADARAVVERYGLNVPDAVVRALEDPANETPKPGDPIFARASFALASRPADVFLRAEAAARAAGYECLLLGTNLEGEARNIAARHAELARSVRAQGRRAVILSGGELTVTVRGKGRGGPNQEYVLALAEALGGTDQGSARQIAALAADTDGTDGGIGEPNDPAGAFMDETTATRAGALGLDPSAFLDDNNSTEFFRTLGDLVTPGPTYTNVNDFRAILVDSA